MVCKLMKLCEITGRRAWSYGRYYAEANVTQEQWGTIPGPKDAVFNHTMGLSLLESTLTDEEQTDGMITTNAMERLRNFSRDGTVPLQRIITTFLQRCHY